MNDEHFSAHVIFQMFFLLQEIALAESPQVSLAVFTLAEVTQYTIKRYINTSFTQFIQKKFRSFCPCQTQFVI